MMMMMMKLDKLIFGGPKIGIKKSKKSLKERMTSSHACLRQTEEVEIETEKEKRKEKKAQHQRERFVSFAKNRFAKTIFLSQRRKMVSRGKKDRIQVEKQNYLFLAHKIVTSKPKRQFLSRLIRSKA